MPRPIAATPPLIVQSLIPWDDLKQEHLEELLYWLLDDLGLRDLRWRRGGAKTTTSDGGRDLEGTFQVETLGELQPQRWWIEAKGRRGTVERSAVEKALLNAQTGGEVDLLLIATNTQFSNPTRDMVENWQKQHPRPKVLLWQRENLESHISRHLSAVFRLFTRAMSVQGRLAFAGSQFWNHARCPTVDELAMFWRERDNLEWTHQLLITVLAGEAAHQSLHERAWLATRPRRDIKSLLMTTIANAIPISERAEAFGSREEAMMEMFAHVVLSATRALGSRETTAAIKTLYAGRGPKMLKAVVRSLRSGVVAPILEIARRQLAPVCMNGCKRVDFSDDSEYEDADADAYWKRFVPCDEPKEPKMHLVMIGENPKVPCRAGLPLDNDRRCPLLERRQKPSPVDQLDRTLAEFELILADIIRRRGSAD